MLTVTTHGVEVSGGDNPYDTQSYVKAQRMADALAGMLLEIKGEFPALHEKVTYHNYEFEVLEMDSRRILKVKFTILPKEMEDGVVSAV